MMERTFAALLRRACASSARASSKPNPGSCAHVAPWHVASAAVSAASVANPTSRGISSSSSTATTRWASSSAFAARGFASSASARAGRGDRDHDPWPNNDPRYVPVLDTPAMDRAYEEIAEEIKRSPKKKQRFLMGEALKGTRLKPIFFAEKQLERERPAEPKQLMCKVIDVNRTCKVTKQGGIMSFTALVVVGNGEGVCGHATGKGKDVQQAVEKAYQKACRSLVHIERFENYTVYHAARAKYKKTYIKIFPMKKYEGLRVNQIVEAICDCAGITDLSAKVIGSHHPMNTVRVTFEALEKIQSPIDIAQSRGMSIYKLD